MEEEQTAADGIDLIKRQIISVSDPSGQYFDKASIAVKGIVMLSNKSNTAKWATRISLVFSEDLALREGAEFEILLRLRLCEQRASRSKELAENDARVNITYRKM